MAAVVALYFLALLKFGVLGFMGLTGILFMVLLTPLLMNRYWFFLVLWQFISPVFDNMRTLLVAGTNPVIFLITGITVPFAFYLILRDSFSTMKALPFLGFLMAFNLVIFINLFRPEAEPGVLLEGLKLTIEIFIIICGYHEIRSGRARRLFQGINLFMLLNSCIAIFQRVTGIGMTVIEGLPRVGGLVGHPNCLAFVNVLYIPFGIYQYLQADTKKERLFWLAGVLISALALILTLCKNVIFCGLLQLFVLFFFLPNRLKIRLGLAVLTAMFIFLGLDALFHLGFQDQFTDRMNNSDSMVWRLKIWGYLLSLIDLPGLLLGHGVNAARALIHMVDSRGSDYVHNAYLQLLYDYGVSGLFYLMAFLQPTWHFAQKFLKSKDTVKLRAMMPLLVLGAIWINMASDNSVFLRTPMSFAWLILSYFYLLPQVEPANSKKFRLPEEESTLPTAQL
jgi:hypothetical protein